MKIEFNTSLGKRGLMRDPLLNDIKALFKLKRKFRFEFGPLLVIIEGVLVGVIGQDRRRFTWEQGPDLYPATMTMSVIGGGSPRKPLPIMKKKDLHCEPYEQLPILDTVTDLITNEYEPSIEKAISSMKQLEKKYGIKFNYVDIDSCYIDWYIP
jgi:hypothetical protein